METSDEFSWIDISIMILYFIVIILLGICSPLISKLMNRLFSSKSSDEMNQTENYFLAGRSVLWFAVAASLFSSNIGSEHMVGLTGSAANIKSGMSVAYYEFSGSMLLLMLAYIFIPVYLQSKIFTTPEYIEKRFSSHLRTCLAIMALVVYIFTKISVTIFAACIVFETVLGLNMWISSTILLLSCGVYTMIGGFHAVIYTELLQTFILLFGSLVLMILSFQKVGGLEAIRQARPEHFHMIKPITDTDFPWPGLFFGIPINGIYYWMTDQLMVQRVISARSEQDAKLGCIVAGFLKLLPIFMLVIPGIIASYLFEEEVRKDSNKAFTLLVIRLMPPVLKGIMISSMLSAAMSSLSSVFNSASTIITLDIYQRFKPFSSQRELVLVGRISSSILVIISLLWMPFISTISDQLYIYIQSVASYLSPPIAVVFLAGILFKWVTSAAAIAAVVMGCILGCLRFLFEIQYKHQVQVDWFIWIFSQMNYLYFGMLLFAITWVIIIIVSIFTEKPKPEQVEEYCVNWSGMVTDWKEKIELLRNALQRRKQKEETTPTLPSNSSLQSIPSTMELLVEEKQVELEESITTSAEVTTSEPKGWIERFWNHWLISTITFWYDKIVAPILCFVLANSLLLVNVILVIYFA